MGRYQELPTNVTANRTQAWAILRAPTYRLGALQLYGQLGYRNAVYNDFESTYQTTLGIVGIKTAETARDYANIAYIHRIGAGQSPFLFDQVQIPVSYSATSSCPSRRTIAGAWGPGIVTTCPPAPRVTMASSAFTRRTASPTVSAIVRPRGSASV